MESGPIPDVKLVAGAGFEPGAIDRATEETASNMLPVNAEKCPTVVTHCHAHSAAKRDPRTARLAGKIGSVVVPIYPLSYIRKNGSEVQQYCVSYYEAGRRVRRNFASIDEAKAFAEKQARAIGRGEREAGTSNYVERRAMLESLLPCDAVFGGDTARPVPCGAVVLTPTQRADSHANALALYQRLRDANRVLGYDFFEGVVMKRADSIYPVQLRSATEELRGWCKHPFLL